MNEFVDMYRCPLTRLLIAEPVLAEDDTVYERIAIEKWFMDNDVSPVTNQIIKKKLRPMNHHIDVINKLIENNPFLVNEMFGCVYPFNLFAKQFIQHLLNGDFHELLSYRNIYLTDIVNDKCTTIIEYLVKRCKDNSVIKYIIDNSVDYDTVDSVGQLPIHIACRFSNNEIINHLLNKGVCIDIENVSGSVPIHYYLKYNSDINVDTVKKLTVNKKNSVGLEPLHTVCINSGKVIDAIAVVNTLLSVGADLDVLSDEGYLPVDYACLYSSNVEFITYMLDITDISSVNRDELIYKNSNLSINDKRELVLTIINNIKNKVVLIEEYLSV